MVVVVVCVAAREDERKGRASYGVHRPRERKRE